ncbi:MAG: ribonuclease H family protein [Aeromonas sp.]
MQPEKVIWSPKVERAFQELKRVLTSSPILYALDFCLPLQTDPFDTGLGAILSQERDGEEHPVMYISRKFEP